MKTRRSPRSPLEITVLKQGTPSKKVLSASFFTMKGAYRDVSTYEASLKKFLKQKENLKGFETRIYTDDSGKDIVLKAVKEDPDVTILHFNFQPLREQGGHIGTFGTLVRFLPFFEPGLEVVWVSDIDIPDSYLNPSVLTKMKETKTKFSFRTFLCYETKVYGRKYTILAGTMISFHTFPKQLFNQFLNSLVRPPNSLQIMFSKLNAYNVANKNRNVSYSKIPFGVDEVFTNTTFYNYLIRHEIPCYIIKEYINLMPKYLTGLITEKEKQLIHTFIYKKKDKETFDKIKDFCKEKLPLVVSKYPCVKDFLNRMDEFTPDTSFFRILLKKGNELNK
jgi:hypothetical protein